MSHNKRKKVLTNFFVIAWFVLVGYLVFIHLSRADFSDDIKILWKLQQLVSKEESAKMLPSYLDAKSYLDNIDKALNDPSIEVIDLDIIEPILDDQTMSEWEKSRQIIKNYLDIIIKLNYGICEVRQNQFAFELRDKCHGDFSLNVQYIGTYDNWKITELLLYKRINQVR